MAIVCSIKPENQKLFKQGLAMELHGLRTEGEPFNLKDFVNYIYDVTYNDLTEKNKDVTLQYMMLVPRFVKDLTLEDTDLMKYLSNTPGILEELAKGIEDFESDLANIEAYRGNNQEKFDRLATIAIQNIEQSVSGKVKETNVTSKIAVNNASRITNRPKTALKTGIGNAISIVEGTKDFNVEIPELETQTKIKKALVARVPMIKEQDQTVSLPNVGPVYFMPFTISQIQELVDEGAKVPDYVIERIKKSGVGLVLVNNEGFPVFFDNNLTDSIDNIEGTAYVDAFVNATQEQVSGAQPLLQEHKDMVKSLERTQRLTPAEAESLIRQELKKIVDLKKYAINNPNTAMFLNITGGKGGYVHFDYEINTPISSINFEDENFYPNIANATLSDIGEYAGKTYFYLNSIPGQPLEIERPRIAESFANQLALLLTEDIFYTDKNGFTRPINDAVRFQIANDYIFLSDKGLNVSYDLDTGKYEVTIFGTPLDLTNKKDAYTKVFKHLSKLSPKREIDAKDANERINKGAIVVESSDPQRESKFAVNALYRNPNGRFQVIEYQKLNFSNRAITNGYIEFNLNPYQNGYMLNAQIKDAGAYREFIRQNGFIHYQVNDKGKIVSMNPYLTYDIPSEVLDKLYPQTEVKPEPAPKNVTTDPNLSDFDFLGDWATMDKNIRQKLLNAGVDQETLEKIKDWYNSTDLKDKFPLRVMFNVVNTARPNSVATFFQSGITLWKGSDYSDIYHEAWHAFSQFYLTQAQKDELYDSLRKKKGTFVDYQGHTQYFSTAKDKQLEEYIAEDFRDYMLYGQKAKKNEPVRNTLFRKIYEALKALFEKLGLVDVMVDDRSNPLIKQYYDVLRVGNLSEYTFNQENYQFREGLDKTLEAINKDEQIQVTSKDTSKLIKDSVDALLSEYRTNMNKPLTREQNQEFERLMNIPEEDLTDIEKNRLAVFQKKQLGKFTVLDMLQPKKLSAAYNYVKFRFDQDYQKFSEQLNALIDIKKQENPALTDEQINALPDVKEIKYKTDTLGYALRNFGDTKNIENNQKYKGVIGYHFAKSTYISQQIRENLLNELEEEDNKENFKLFEKSANDISFIAMADKEILYLVQGLYRTNEQGQIEKNKLGYPVLVKGKTVMNRLAKILNGLQSPEQMAKRIQLEIDRGNVTLKQLLDELGNPTEYEKANVYEMWDKFWNTFNLTRISPVMQNFNTDVTEEIAEGIFGQEETVRTVGGYSMYTGTSPSIDVENIKRKWSLNFQQNYNSEYLKQDSQGRYLDSEGLNRMMKTYRDQIVGKEKQFLEEFGINIPEQAWVDPKMATEINKLTKFIFQKLEEADRKHVYENDKYNFSPIRSIKDLEIPFSDIIGNKIKNNLNTDIKNLAKIADMFTESSSEFMFTNAAGDSKYELSKNSTITQKINAINEVDSFEELVRRPEFSHLRSDLNSFVAFSIRFNTIFDFDKPYGPKRKYDAQGKLTNDPRGKKASLSIRDLSGILTMTNGVADGKGKVSASLSEFEKFIHDIHSALSGNIEHPRHADKSTYSAVTTDTYLIGEQGRKRLVSVANMVIPDDLSAAAYKKLLSLENQFEKEKENMDSKAYSEMVGMQQSTKYYNPEMTFLFENVFIPYITAEHGRINKFKNLQKMFDEKPDTVDYYMDFDYLKRGQTFHIFDKVLSPSTKEALMNITEPLDVYLKTADNDNLKNAIFRDLRHYFEDQTNLALDKFAKAQETQDLSFIAPNVIGDIRAELIRSKKNAKDESIRRAIVRGYTVSTFISIFEDMTMFYGDIAEYLMAEKDEGHKRNALFGSFGDVPRNDRTAQLHIQSIGRKFAESQGYKDAYTAYDGSLKTAVLEDVTTFSSYILSNYVPAVIEDSKRNLLKNPENKKLSKQQLDKLATETAYNLLKEYGVDPKTGKVKDKMKVADAQGWVTFDSYRMLLKLYRKWTPAQEDMYQRIAKGEDISTKEVLKTFPVTKLQYSGPVANDFMSSMAAHKYSLFPLIPTVIKGKGLDKLHQRLMSQGLDYAVMKSGSKISTITKNGVTDKFYSDKKKAVVDMAPVAINTIYVPFLKYQTHVEPEFKGQISFFSQMRKLIENNLFEGGVPTDFMPEVTDLNAKVNAWDALSEDEKFKKSDFYSRVFKYETHLKDLVDTKKQQLLRELDWKYVDGKLTGKLSKLLEFVEKQMERQNLSEQEIELIKEMRQGTQHDLSLLMNAEKIEKLLNAIIVRRLVKPKIKGEGLIQVSNVGFENAEAFAGARKFELASEEELEKYGTHDLPAARLLKRADGSYYVKGAKVKIAIQGDYKKLLNLKEVVDLAQAENITTLQALNKLIKSEEWLDKGDNRKMVRLIGARIPTQGHNSMEYVEVHEFLPELAGNIIVPPYEIVAKSGGDFDVDKLFMMMPHLKQSEGKVELFKRYSKGEIRSMYGRYMNSKLWQFETPDNIKQKIADIFNVPFEEWSIEVSDDEMFDELVRQGKAMTIEEFENTVSGSKAIENELLDDIAGLLLLPENFVSVITPNDVSIAKPLADTLAKVSRTYNMYHNPWGEDLNYISSTNFFEFGHNLFKHSSNSVGKQTLGLGAVDNTFNAIFNRIGMYLNPSVTVKTKKSVYQKRVEMKLAHNSYIKNGEKVISLSHLMDVNNQHKISEIISQMINGWVDVAKDAWIFDIQGNKIISPTLLFMVQAGVPFEQAVYFVSQPIIVEYINEILDHQSIFSETLGKRPENPYWAEAAARRKMVAKYQDIFKRNLTPKEASKFNPSVMLANKTIYDLTVKITNKNEDAFTLPFLQENIRKTTRNEKDMAILTHFFELQDHAKSLKNIKIKINFDTSKSTTLYDAMKKQRAVDEVIADGRIPSGMIEKILKNTPIGPFFVQEFQQEVWGDLFELRNHRYVNNEITNMLVKNSASIDSLFEDEEQAVITYKNDLNSYIFQNAVKAFDEKNLKSYKGLDVDVEIKEAPGLKYAAVVMDVDGVKKLYVNKRMLEAEWRTNEYTQASYQNKGYATVNKRAFEDLGFKEYMHFVLERAVVEDMYSYSDVYQRLDYKHMLSVNQLNNKKLESETPEEYAYRMAELTYKEWIRDTALNNIFNIWQMFYSENSYAETFGRIRAEYPDLYKEFSIMDGMNVAPKRKTLPAALMLMDPKADIEIMDIYRDDILSLSNETVEKVPNEQDNQMITNYFKRFSIYAMFQSGMTERGPFAIGRLANSRQILSILEPASKDFVSKLEKNPKLLNEVYTNRFLNANRSKAERSRLKNFTKSTFLERTNIASTISPALTYYSDKVLLFDVFKNDTHLLNPEALFLFDSDKNNTSSTERGLSLTLSDMSNALPFKGKINQGTSTSSYYKDIVNEDGSITMNPELKNIIDEFISTLEKYQGPIAFPRQGLGQYMIGLQEELQRKKVNPVYGQYDFQKMLAPASFQYLSRQLFEKFEYINPYSMDLLVPETIIKDKMNFPIMEVPYDTLHKTATGYSVEELDLATDIGKDESGITVMMIDKDLAQEQFDGKIWTKLKNSTAMPENQFVSVEEYMAFLINREAAKSYVPREGNMSDKDWNNAINQEAMRKTGMIVGQPIPASQITLAGNMNLIHNQLSATQSKPGLLNKELTDKKIFNTWDAIIAGLRTQTSRDLKSVNYGPGQYIYFTNTYFSKLKGQKLIVRVEEVSDKTIGELIKENPDYANEWSKNEGWNPQYLKDNPSTLKKYPIKFTFVGVQDASGNWLTVSPEYRNESLSKISNVAVETKTRIPEAKMGIRSTIIDIKHPEVTNEMVMEKLKFCGIFTL